MTAIGKAVAKDGFKIVMLLRLSPAFPFAIMTLILSLTQVDNFIHLKATVIGLIPSSFVYIYAGAMGADAADGAWGFSDWAIAIGGLVATVLATAKVVKVADAALQGGAERKGNAPIIEPLASGTAP